MSLKERTESPDKNARKKTRSRFEIYCEAMGVNHNLIMLKVTLFMMYGASASLIPFLTIHMQSIGLTVEEIAIIYLALPLTTFLSPPITGFIVDRFGHYKLVVILSLVLNGVFHHSLMLIPQMETPGETPVAYVLRHPQTGKVEVWWSPCPSRECPVEEDVDLVLDDCVDHCTLNQKTPVGLLTGIHESIAVKPPTFINPVNQEREVVCDQGKKRRKAEKKPTFGIHGDTVLGFHMNRTAPKRKKDYALGKHVNFTIVRNKTIPRNSSLETTTLTPLQTNFTDGPTTPREVFFKVDMHQDLMAPSEHLGMVMEPDDNETVTDFRQHFSEELLINGGVNYTILEEADLRCGGFVVATNLTYDTLKELAADCMLQICQFREGGPDICPPNYQESAPHVFWIYFGLRFLGTTMLSASVTVMDPIALTMVQQYGGEFGRERLFSTIGMAIFSPISGVLIDYSSRKLGYTDYSAAFYTYSALMAISSLAVLFMPIGAKLPADNLLRDMLKLLQLPHVIMFIFYLFVLGNCWGFIESYLFLYLKELGASNYLLGITVSVGTLSSIPFLYGAGKLTKKFGHVNLIVIAFFAHAARLMGYSYINEAWWCFPFEAIEAVSVHLLWVAAATYCAVIAPKNLLATLIGVLGMAHFSLGRGSGSFFGGILIGTVGTRQSFRYMGLLAVVGGATYGILHFFWLHKYSDDEEKTSDASESEKLDDKEDEEKADAEALSQSLERLSLMIRFNHRGSLASLTGVYHPVYSRKVFVGGLPHGVTFADLSNSFSVCGRIKEICFPENEDSTPKSNRRPTKGYAFVVFEDASGIDRLLKNVAVFDHKKLIKIQMRKHAHMVEVKLWKKSDCFYKFKPSGVSYPLRLFLGGIRSSVTADEVAHNLNQRYGTVTNLKIDTCSAGYPVGTAEFQFEQELSYELALVYNKLRIAGKACEIKPYIRNVRCLCGNAADDLCIPCKQYLCNVCFGQTHFAHDYSFRLSLGEKYCHRFENFPITPTTSTPDSTCSHESSIFDSLLNTPLMYGSATAPTTPTTPGPTVQEIFRSESRLMRFFSNPGTAEEHAALAEAVSLDVIDSLFK